MWYGFRVRRQGSSRRFASYHASNFVRTSVGDGSPIARLMRRKIHQHSDHGGGPPGHAKSTLNKVNSDNAGLRHGGGQWRSRSPLLENLAGLAAPKNEVERGHRDADLAGEMLHPGLDFEVPLRR